MEYCPNGDLQALDSEKVFAFLSLTKVFAHCSRAEIVQLCC